MGEPQLPIFTASHGRAGPAQLWIAPEMRVVGIHEEKVFVILAGDHGIASVDAAGKEGHAFVLHGASIQRDRAEIEKISCFEKLWQDGAAIIGGVSRVVEDPPVVLDKTDEAGLFHPIAFVG